MNDLTVIVVVLFGFLVVTGTGFYLIYRIPILVQRIRYNRETRNYEKAFAKKKQIKREKAWRRTAEALRHFGVRVLAFVSGAREVLSSLVFQFVFLLFFVRERLSVMFYRELVLAPVKIPSVPKKLAGAEWPKENELIAEKSNVNTSFENPRRLLKTAVAKTNRDEEILERLRRRREEAGDAIEPEGIFVGLITFVRGAVSFLFERRRREKSTREKNDKLVDCYERLIGAKRPRNGGNKPKKGGKEMAQELRTFRVSWFLFWGLIVLGIGASFLKPPLGFALFGLAMLFVGTCLHEVRAPEVGMLYKRGKFVAELKPGWYLTIPHFWDIRRVNTSWLQRDVSGEMYTKDKTAIVVRGRVFFKASRMKGVLMLSVEEMKDRAEVLGLSALRTVIGGHTFSDLVSAKLALEDKATQMLKKEFSRYGYTVRDFEIYDFDEKVWSEAERTKALGKARGEAAAALAASLKDNYPAAMVSAVGTIAETVAQIAQTVVAKKHKESSGKKEKGSASSSPGESEDVGSRVGSAINKLLGRG